MCKATLCTPASDTLSSPQLPTIGDIFRRCGAAYRQKYAHRMSQDQLKVMAMLERCRTGELGSVLYRCQNCGKKHVMPRSCGNRHCPLCQGHKAKQWFETQLEKLLPCAYFLITFTVPAALRSLIRSHPRECYRALFDTAAATLIELACNPRYVGSSQLGFTGVLHTWGRTLSYHPHVHFLVPGGAISEDGQSWLSSRVDFFVPVRAASLIFRAKFRAVMDRLGWLKQIPKQVWSQDWVVHSQAVGDGRRAIQYLAPYVFRVAISNRRLVNYDPGPESDPLAGHVSFTYRKSGSQRYRKMTVTTEEFIRRFLQHVLPRGFQKVRHFGFAHPRRRIDPEWLQMLVTVTLHPVYVLTVMAKPLPVRRPPCCPECGGTLLCIGFQPARHRLCRALDTS